MESKIRLATIEDLKEIQRLSLLQFENELKEEFDTTLNHEWSFSKDGEDYFKGSIVEDDRCIFVSLIDDKIIGYLEGGISQSGSSRLLPKFAELEYMFVLEAYRGTGIGTKLYQSFIGWCKGKGVRRLRTEASSKNAAAVSFYRNNGFVDYDLILERDI